MTPKFKYAGYGFFFCTVAFWLVIIEPSQWDDADFVDSVMLTLLGGIMCLLAGFALYFFFREPRRIFFFPIDFVGSLHAFIVPLIALARILLR